MYACIHAALGADFRVVKKAQKRAEKSRRETKRPRLRNKQNVEDSTCC